MSDARSDAAIQHLRVQPVWPGSPFDIFCPDSPSRCALLNDTAAAVRADCFEPETETMEILVSFLHGRPKGSSTYVDVGCNMGLFAAYAASEGARVDCYEPAPSFRASLAQTASHYGADAFTFHEAAVVGDSRQEQPPGSSSSMSSSVPSSHGGRYVPFVPDNNGYRPCGVGRAGAPRPVPRVPLSRALAGRHVSFLKVDIDSEDGALLHVATNLIESGRASIETILVELGCFHPRLQRGGPCKWAWQGGDVDQPHPRSGDVRDLWRLQRLGYDVYRVNIHTNHEIFDWKGEDVNRRATPRNASSYVPMRFVRAIKALELLRPHAGPELYGQLVRRSQSFLITRERLAQVRQA